jgi:transcriptional regulator with XRE-family HTH domain
MIGKKLRERRLELGMTQEQLAHKIGYKDKTAINKIELDKNDVNQKNLIRLSEALGVSPSYFIDDVEHESNTPEIVNKYAQKLSELSPSMQDNVMKYIDFLIKQEKESK